MPVPSSVLMVLFPKTVAYDFHAISAFFIGVFICAYTLFKLSTPITITRCAGPAGVSAIKRSYYFKPIRNIGLPPRIRTQIPWSVATCLFQLDEQEIKWGQGRDSNPRPSGYEPDELPTAPPCDIKEEFRG